MKSRIVNGMVSSRRPTSLENLLMIRPSLTKKALDYIKNNVFIIQIIQNYLMGLNQKNESMLTSNC